MSGRVFFLLFLAVICASFLVGIIPVVQNNFYFTVDQGRDAVAVRDILVRHILPLRGPQTSIRGIYTGPLWYYFLAAGYFLFGGSPWGGVLMMVALNTFLLWLVMRWIWHKIGQKEAIIVGIGLLIFWPFYEASAYAFNPFPLVALGFGLVYCLERGWLWGALGVVFLAANANLAGAAVFLLSTLVWFGYIRVLGKRGQMLVVAGGGLGVFSGTNFVNVFKGFLQTVGGVVVPQAVWAGVIVFGLSSYWFMTNRGGGFRHKFVLISLFISMISYFFFGATRGWRDWQTVYLAPLLFVSFILMAMSVKNRFFKFLILGSFFVFQWSNFFFRYVEYPGRLDDPGILSNQLKVVDLVYQKSGGDGFGVYTYTKSYYDYPQQYLFWWYGAKRYGYVPCEYSNYPGADKANYISGALTYAVPKRDCGQYRFLIVESPTNGERNSGWIDQYRGVTRLVDKVKTGGATVEMRELTAQSDILFDTNINLYDYWIGPLHLKLPNGWERTVVNGMTMSRFRGGDFVVGAMANGKGCLGKNLSEFVKSAAVLQGGVVVSQREMKMGGVTADWIDLDLRGGNQAVLAVLFRGGINDYFVSVYRRGVLLRADNLTERILKSVAIIEDSGTKPVKGCALGV